MRRALLLAAFLVACGNGPVPDNNVHPFDAGADAPDASTGDGGEDADILGAPCQDDSQCDDGIACTFDTCDPQLLRCRNTPDDTLCDDGVFCNGKELCKRTSGCQPGPVVACSSSTCEISKCVEADKSCTHEPRDLDQDGDPDAVCKGGGDCNDLDPNVSSKHSEICGNGVDDNCNGQTDEAGCVSAQNATCQTAMSITAPGTYAMSTAGAGKTFQTSCTVSKPQTAHDVVAAVTVPAGPNADLDVWVAGPTNGEMSVAIQSACGQPVSELACGAGAGAWSTRARARDVAPGTYYVVVTSSLETSVTLSVDFLSPTPKAANEDCGTATPIAPGTPTTVSLVDPSLDLPDACGAVTGELTYSLTLAQAQDVRVYASTLKGAGQPVVGLRAPSCSGQTDELHCKKGSSLPLFARGVPAGTYVLTVAATTPIDASVLVQLAAPTTSPADELCSSAPPATLNGTLPFDLANHEDAIQDGCYPGAPTAAYDVELGVPSDVLVVARYPQNDYGAVSLDAPGCTQADNLLCWAASTPVRAGKRNLAAGSYRAVVGDTFGQQGTLTTLARPTVASTAVPGADDCGTFVDIPASGGYFTGDTTTHNPDFDDSCDAANQPKGGAADQILRLVLAQKKRVVLSMEGSSYGTILALRQGTSCPGTEIACNYSFSGPRSFLDQTLAPGTYWVIIDGWGGQKGTWDLDAYVVDP